MTLEQQIEFDRKLREDILPNLVQERDRIILLLNEYTMIKGQPDISSLNLKIEDRLVLRLHMFGQHIMFSTEQNGRYSDSYINDEDLMKILDYLADADTTNNIPSFSML